MWVVRRSLLALGVSNQVSICAWSGVLLLLCCPALDQGRPGLLLLVERAVWVWVLACVKFLLPLGSAPIACVHTLSVSELCTIPQCVRENGE